MHDNHDHTSADIADDYGPSDYVPTSNSLFGASISSSRSVKVTRATTTTSPRRLGQPEVFRLPNGQRKVIKPRRAPKRVTTRLIGEPAPASGPLYRL